MDAVMSAGCGIGCRGFVVEVDSYAIAWRKLGYSMGPILDAKGDPVSTMTVFHLFLHSETSLEVFSFFGMPNWGRWPEASYDDDQYRVKHRVKKILPLWIKIFSCQLMSFWRISFDWFHLIDYIVYTSDHSSAKWLKCCSLDALFPAYYTRQTRNR